MNFRIIDFHAHAFPEKIEKKAIEHLEEHYGLRIHHKGLIEDLLKSAKKAGVEIIVVHATATSPSQVQNVNNWISSVVREGVIGFGTIHPEYPNCIDELKRIKDLGLKGLKLHPDFQGFDIDDPVMYPIYEAIEPGFPVLFHSGDENLDHSSPHRLARVLDLFPHLTVIAAHLGGYAKWDDVRRYLIGKNLYFDTSSCLFRLSKKEATDIIRSHGADRIVFGTDYPVASHTEELERFFELPLTDEERRKILYDNAARILFHEEN